MKKILLAILSLSLLSGCYLEPLPKDENPDVENPGENNPGDENPDEDNPAGEIISDEGLSYIFDFEYIPEIHLTIPLDQWNKMLSEFDKDPNTSEYFKCDVRYVKGAEEQIIKEAGFRLKGNTSRRRPEGNTGQMHDSAAPDWHHCHFQLNLTKFQKGDQQEIHGVKKLYCKWFKDDSAYAREVFCYDLFRRFGVWTAAFDTYCRLWVHVEGDEKEAYYGVYNQIEIIDSRYLKARVKGFGSKDGFLWKCSYGASLSDTDAGKFGNDGSDKAYELKTQTEFYDAALVQLQDFILKLKGKGEDSFYKWIKEVCDVDLLLKTYAVNVAVGMWDDYWKNSNNFYIYFNSQDQYDYKFFFIPYDYDNTLGTSGMDMDSGRQDPLNWGNNNNLLIYRLLKFEDFRQTYKSALLDLVDPVSGEMYYKVSMDRIRKWQEKIGPYISNDTGEDMKIEDRPASWGNHGEYRLLEENNNFFKIKAETINRYCK